MSVVRGILLSDKIGARMDAGENVGDEMFHSDDGGIDLLAKLVEHVRGTSG